jgi:hypothetical protein
MEHKICSLGLSPCIHIHIRYSFFRSTEFSEVQSMIQKLTANKNNHNFQSAYYTEIKYFNIIAPFSFCNSEIPPPLFLSINLSFNDALLIIETT